MNSVDVTGSVINALQSDLKIINALGQNGSGRARRGASESPSSNIFGKSQPAKKARKVRFDVANGIDTSLREVSGWQQFASSQTTTEYAGYAEQNEERFARYRDELGYTLYACIIPSCLGKTTMCRRMPYIDIDNIVVDKDINARLTAMRQEAISMPPDDPRCKEIWVKHNREWFGYLRSVMRLAPFSASQVVLVHSEECALEIGAIPLCAILPKEMDSKIGLVGEHRASVIEMALRNRATILHRTTTCPIVRISDITESAGVVASFVSQKMEIPAPFHWAELSIVRTSQRWPVGWSREAPSWALKGEMITDCMVEITRLRSEGVVPEIAVSWYETLIYDANSIDYGCGMSAPKWGELAGMLYPNLLEPKQLPKELSSKTEWIELYPFESELERKNCYVDLRALAKLTNFWEDKYAYRLLSVHVGSRHTLVCALICWWMGVGRHLRSELREAIISSRLLECSDDAWVKVQKEAHSQIRAYRAFGDVKLTNSEMSNMMYLHMLYGRKTYTLDASAEIIKRQRDIDWLRQAPDALGVWSAEEYRTLIVEGIRDAYARIRRSPRPDINWKGFVEWWKRRRDWCARGSTTMTLPDIDKKYKIDVWADEFVGQLENRHDKKTLLEDNEQCFRILNGVLDNVGLNCTRAVPKLNENAAERVLLPANLYHYIAMSAVLGVFEKTAQVGSTQLNASLSSEDIRSLDMRMCSRLMNFCYDWADYNSQESAFEMRTVMDELHRLCYAGGHSDLSWFISWCAKSMNKMELLDNEGKYHKLYSGLFSGWRGTTWINTVMNHAYMYVASVTYQRLHGRRPFVAYDGAGDDAHAQVLCTSVGLEMYRIMQMIGFDGNAIKQLFGSVAEFLRILYCRDGVYGCVTRALGNFVSGSWESACDSLSERMSGIVTNINVLALRGLDPEFAAIMQRAAVLRWSRVKIDDEWVSPSPVVLHSYERLGGLGVPDEDGCLWVPKEPLPAPIYMAIKYQLPATDASSDWLQVMRGDLDRYSLTLRIDQELKNKVACDSYGLRAKSRDWGALDEKAWARYWLYDCEISEKVKVVGHVEDAPTYQESRVLYSEFERYQSTYANIQPTTMKNYRTVQRYTIVGSHITDKDGLQVDWRKVIGGNLELDECNKAEFHLGYDIAVPSTVANNVADWARFRILVGDMTAEEGMKAFWGVCWVIRTSFDLKY